jgi:hypothetical protein
MLNFMLIGLPRSGTTWAANLFTTDYSLCHHDPLYTTHYKDWDKEFSNNKLKIGISCTGIWRWSDWLNKHPAKKVILHRDVLEISKSMLEIGLPPLDYIEDPKALDNIQGLHVQHKDLFDCKKCCDIWDYLMDGDIPFNWERHRLLIDIEMQPKFVGLSVGKEVTRRLMIELASIGNEDSI